MFDGRVNIKLSQTAKDCFFTLAKPKTVVLIERMNFEDSGSDSDGREKQYVGVRLFKDQLESLDWLIIHKYRNNRSRSELIREYLDKGVEEEKRVR